MTGYLCLLPFNFDDPSYIEMDNMVLDHGMGLESDYLFECALNILFELTTIDEILDYLVGILFPEHVPNDAVSSSVSLCITFISHILYKFAGYKGRLNLLVTQLNKVSLDRYSSTVTVKFNAGPEAIL